MAGHSEERVFYRVHYQQPSCFDDGDSEHDQWWHEEVAEFPAPTDAAAIEMAKRDYRRPESCYHGRTSYPTKLERLARCNDRIAEVPLRAG